MNMNAEKVHELAEQVTYREGYWIEVGDVSPCTARSPLGSASPLSTEGPVAWIEVAHRRPDANTGTPGIGRGGKRYIHSNASESDVVRAIFGAFMSYEEHEVREFFRFRETRIFDPHADIMTGAQRAVEALLESSRTGKPVQ